MLEKMTCPFTGVEFMAEILPDGGIQFENPLTGETSIMNNVPLEQFTYLETFTPMECADFLGVTKQRISQIIKRKTIPVHIVAGKPVFLKLEVEYYKRTRKVGAPKKGE